jgi:hypothetical protein
MLKNLYLHVLAIFPIPCLTNELFLSIVTVSIKPRNVQSPFKFLGNEKAQTLRAKINYLLYIHEWKRRMHEIAY